VTKKDIIEGGIIVATIWAITVLFVLAWEARLFDAAV
jgi:hypothetical protein